MHRHMTYTQFIFASLLIALIFALRAGMAIMRYRIFKRMSQEVKRKGSSI